MNITPTLLKNIATELTNNTLWGMARLNEYAEANSLLRLALLKRANVQIQELLNNKSTAKIMKLLVEGKKLAELSKSQQEQIKFLSQNNSIKNINNFVVKNKISFRERQVALQRNLRPAARVANKKIAVADW